MNGKPLKIYLTAIGCALLIASTNVIAQFSNAEEFKLRCGWLDNPTPSNFSLYDRDDEWLFSVQGGYQLEDFEMPIFKPGQWIVTNTADYGYGCACFEMRVDAETNHVLEIKKSYAKPLSACRKDKALKKWKDF